MTAVYYKTDSASHFTFNTFILLQRQYNKAHQVFYAPTLWTAPSRPKYDPWHHSCRRAVPYSRTGIPVSPSNHNPSLLHQFCGVKYRSQYCCYPYATFWVSRSCTSNNRLTIPRQVKSVPPKTVGVLKQCVLITNHALHLTRLRAGWSGVRILAGAEFHPVSKTFSLSPGPAQPPIQWVAGVLSP
jgi:hypothetical protein